MFIAPHFLQCYGHCIHKVSRLIILEPSVVNIMQHTHAFLQRNLRQCSSSIKSLAYLTYVRPILEYASIVWASYTKCHIASLEKIQCRATCFVCNNYSRYDSVTNMLKMLKWPSLEQRRKQAKCVVLQNILKRKKVCFISLSLPDDGCFYRSCLPMQPFEREFNSE